MMNSLTKLWNSIECFTEAVIKVSPIQVARNIQGTTNSHPCLYRLSAPSSLQLANAFVEGSCMFTMLSGPMQGIFQVETV
uniref:Uncharacterized protein n=1 Tax=Ditylenchus dipsaci TaxID=166011 RepID=A0A915EKY4_9BILA